MKNKPVYVSFYLNKRRLGAAYVKEASESNDRRGAAKKKGICYYNRIVFEGRRAIRGDFKVNDFK